MGNTKEQHNKEHNVENNKQKENISQKSVQQKSEKNKSNTTSTFEKQKKDPILNQASKPRDEVQKKKTDSKARVLGAVALLVALLSCGYHFYHDQQIRSNNEYLAETLAKLIKQTNNNEKQLQNVKGGDNQAITAIFQKQNKELAEQLTIFNEENVKLIEKVTALEKQSKDLQESLSLLKEGDKSKESLNISYAQANFLVQKAQMKLEVDNDLNSAKTLLKEAYELLSNLNNKQASSLANLIKEDINVIDSVTVIDKSSIESQLSQLNKEVTNLPLAQAVRNLEEKTQGVSSSLGDWKNNVKQNVQSFLDKFIHIESKNTSSSSAFISPSKEEYLRENIRLKLNLAQINLFTSDTNAYKDALEEVELWIHSYFDLNDEQVKSFVTLLEKLQQEDVLQDLPELKSPSAVKSLF